ncbi:MAG: hypothetical protein LLF97_11640 [Planctomycetaceae bacterium]|nr:hypothetical protein [Planctomycetaceae bacterium]
MSTDRSVPFRRRRRRVVAFGSRRALTLLELMLAMTVTLMIVGAMAGLARTVQQSYEYSQGYGVATQHARVAIDRIVQNICQAAANNAFPGCLVVPEPTDTTRCPDTLVVWLPAGGTASGVNVLPRFSELVIYCPNPESPNQLLELIASSDTRTVPAADDVAGWQTELASLKTDAATQKTVLTPLLRTASTTGGTSTSELRGAARFDVRLRPSADDWAGYAAGSVTWKNLPWTQSIYGTQTGLRQVWVRMELQMNPGKAWTSTNAVAARSLPFFGSASLYYNMTHP